MSFNNTKTPTLSDIRAKPKFQVPMRKSASGLMEYYLEGKIKEEFIKRYPIYENRKIMAWFGIGFSTMQRFKRELNLKKDMNVIRKRLAKQVKKICEDNGYYDSIRGKAPSQQCLDAYQRKLETGWNPTRDFKEKHPAKFRAMHKKLGERISQLHQADRNRKMLGLNQKTKRKVPMNLFTRQQTSFKHNMLKLGYIIGDPDEQYGERFTIFYDDDTDRRPQRELNAVKYGFTILPLN